jgi:fibronectin type III domain protein
MSNRSRTFESRIMNKFRAVVVIGLFQLLAACGGHSPWNGDDSDDAAGVPSAPIDLTANVGDGAISLGWGIPTTNGDTALTYNVTIAPTTNAAQIIVSGTTALIRGLTNGTTYTLSVTAANTAGTGAPAPITSKPGAADTSDYLEVDVTNDPPLNGYVDPSLLRAADGRIWMVYTDIEANGNGQITRSAIRLAHSNDGGNSYIFDREIGTPNSVDIIQPNSQWHYRTPWLIEDSSDPDATRRFKLFAHKHFFNTLNNSFQFQQGAIVLWTAATPDGPWSIEQSLLGWTGTPAALNPLRIVNALDSSLQSCQWFDDGSAAIYNGGIDLVLNCVDNSTLVLQRKTILLRSTDHLNSFTYVATLLQPSDALAYNDAESFSGPALLPNGGNAPVLFATPLDSFGNALGCIVFPIANQQTGVLFTANNAPLALQTLPAAGSDSGSCTWDRGLSTRGILMSDREESTYTLQATGKSL